MRRPAPPKAGTERPAGHARLLAGMATVLANPLCMGHPFGVEPLWPTNAGEQTVRCAAGVKLVQGNPCPGWFAAKLCLADIPVSDLDGILLGPRLRGRTG